jgi:hypothetical protein
MIDWYASRSHRIDKFFSKIISFATVLQAHSNLIGRQKSDVIIVGGGGRRSPRIVIRRTSDPKLRKIAELRPCLWEAEQLDAPF